VIIFGKFGDGRSKEDRAVQVRAMTGHGLDGVDSLRSSRLTRAIDLSCAPSMCAGASDVTFPPATNGGVAHARKFPSPGFNRASFRLPHPSPISNRELDLLERHLNHCKQRAATVSNRELWTIRNFAHSPMFMRDQVAVLSGGIRIAGCGSRSLASLLTGSASQTEITVTHSKQTLATFLTGSRIARMRFAERRVQP
jgi:hypothetical protein